jgi:hypothetical protein
MFLCDRMFSSLRRRRSGTQARSFTLGVSCLLTLRTRIASIASHTRRIAPHSSHSTCVTSRAKRKYTLQLTVAHIHIHTHADVMETSIMEGICEFKVDSCPFAPLCGSVFALPCDRKEEEDDEQDCRMKKEDSDRMLIR